MRLRRQHTRTYTRDTMMIEYAKDEKVSLLENTRELINITRN